MRIEERTENVKYFISEDGNEFKCEKHCLRYEELANVNYYHKKLCDVSFYNRSVSKNINDVFILEYKKIFIHGE